MADLTDMGTCPTCGAARIATVTEDSEGRRGVLVCSANPEHGPDVVVPVESDEPLTMQELLKDMKLPPMIEVQMREDGILWMLNRTVFHPRGFALGIDREHPTRLFLQGDGTEPWSYDPSIEEIENDLFNRFEAMLDRQRQMATGEAAGHGG